VCPEYSQISYGEFLNCAFFGGEEKRVEVSKNEWNFDR